jgi:hypothetical protein
MRFRFRYTGLLLGTLILSTSISCKNYTCGPRAILTAFIGFQQADIDTFTIKRYKANDNFATLLDSFVITNRDLNGGKGDGIYTLKNDTTLVFVNGSYPNNGVFPGFDFKIFIPARNRTISISNIISPDTEGSMRCTNPINSFQVDDIMNISPTYLETGDNVTRGYRAYITP